MHLVTQIGSTHQSNSKALASMLKEHNVLVTHLEADEFIFSQTTDPWERHEAFVRLYTSIGNCSFHTVLNGAGIITKDLSLQILYAMLNGKPVLLQELPTFADKVDTFAQRLISSRLQNFYVSDLTRSTSPEVAAALRHFDITTVDYALNHHDEVLIRAKIRNHFRDLLREEVAEETVETEVPTLAVSFA